MIFAVKTNARTVVGREGGVGPYRYVTSDMSYHWEGAREWCEDDKWHEEKEKQSCKGMTTTAFLPVSGILTFLFSFSSTQR